MLKRLSALFSPSIHRSTDSNQDSSPINYYASFVWNRNPVAKYKKAKDARRGGKELTKC